MIFSWPTNSSSKERIDLFMRKSLNAIHQWKSYKRYTQLIMDIFHLLNLRRNSSYITRLQQPDSIMTVICLPRSNTPGSDYKQLVKEIQVCSYLSNRCLLTSFLCSFTIHHLIESTYLLVVHIIYSWPTNSSPKENINLFMRKS